MPFSTQESKRQANLYEIEVSLVYVESGKTSWSYRETLPQKFIDELIQKVSNNLFRKF